VPAAARSPMTALLAATLAEVAADLAAKRLAVHLCPRVAMTAEPPACSPVRFWAAATVSSSGGADVFMDDACPDVLEALVHVLLRLKGHGHDACMLAEAAVSSGGGSGGGGGGGGGGMVSVRMRQELRRLGAADVLQALAAEGAGLTPPPEVGSSRGAAAAAIGGEPAPHIEGLAAHAAAQTAALCALIDDGCLHGAVDHRWMQATHAAWAALARACIAQHQAGEVERPPAAEGSQKVRA